MLKKALALMLLAFTSMPWADAPHIRILSTEPRITGPALALSEAMLDRAGLAYSVEVVPWARAYHMAQNEADVLLFTVARTPEREPLFNWIGETFPIDFRAYRLQQRTDIVIRTPADLKHYRLSVVRDSSIVPYLQSLGLKQADSEPGLQIINGIEDHWPKLEHGRVDLFVATSLSVAGMCANGDLDCSRIASAWTFSNLRMMAWLAFSRATDKAIVARASSAYRSLRSDGSFDRIMAPLSVVSEQK